MTGVQTCALPIFDVSGALARRLCEIGHEAALAEAGAAYGKDSSGIFFIRPGEEGDYKRLLQDLSAQGYEPDFIVYALSLTEENRYSVLYLLCGAATNFARTASSLILVVENAVAR